MALFKTGRAILVYPLLRSLLFRIDAERSHDFALEALKWASKSPLALKALRSQYANKISPNPVDLMGMKLTHPLGLAAGLDKQGVAGDALSAFGFSFIEYGTVTPKPQPGNPKPRLFRLPEHNAIINRMGFNSIGLDAFLNNIDNSNTAHFKGLNIGKNAATPIEHANDDYVIGLNAAYEVADYICINISSPNTTNLRELQADEPLNALLAVLAKARAKLADKTGQYKPMALKVAPDIDAAQIDHICKALLKYNFDGLVATNTSLNRKAVLNHRLGNETGGLSGAPIAEQSTQCIQQFADRLQGEIAIIGVGGIEDAKSAKVKLQAGATAIQLYTSFIYQGPAILKRICESF